MIGIILHLLMKDLRETCRMQMQKLGSFTMKTLSIFEDKEHYLTVVDRTHRKNARRLRIRNCNQLQTLLDNQAPNTDYYITKYAKSDVVWNIILDFDCEEDKKVAYTDCLTLRGFLSRKGINAVIVDSTNKGYHLYIEIPPTNFREFAMSEIEEPSLFFKHYVSELCQLGAFKFKSLDEVNYNASLDGNIRLIGSRHPKTDKEVYIKLGEFTDIIENPKYYEEAMRFHTKVYEVAYDNYRKELDEIEIKRLQYANRLKTHDDLLNKDLRDVFKEIFPLRRVKEYGEYMWLSCPFHANDSVNFCVSPKFFFCTSCGIKGNIFSLIKMGYLEAPKEEIWLTDGAKKVLDNGNIKQ